MGPHRFPPAWTALAREQLRASVKFNFREMGNNSPANRECCSHHLGMGSPQERQTVALMCRGLPQRGQIRSPASIFITGEELP